MSEPTLSEPLLLDGSHGGGQLLRSSLTLSLATGVPFELHQVRGARPKPGLRAQHLACVRAAQEVGGAEVHGAAIGSSRLSFAPGPVRGGTWRFDVGTAGSALLVLHTVLPALLRRDLPESRVEVVGGTHNPMAPPFEHTDRAWRALVQAQGADVALDLVRPGFAPLGDGEVHARTRPGALQPVRLHARTGRQHLRATAIVCNLDPDIGRRELRTLARELSLPAREGRVEAWDVRGGEDGAHHASSTGNCLLVEVAQGPVPAVCSELGEVRRRAEEVAVRLARQVRRHLEHDGPLDEHLADQALLLLALGRGGSFRTGKPTEHLRTHAALLPRFLPDCRVTVEAEGGRTWKVTVEGEGPLA